MKTLLLLFMLWAGAILYAQNPVIDESYNSESGIANAVDYAELMESLLLHPLNINTAERSALSELHLLTALQINALISHRLRYGSLLSLYELQSIPGFDVETIKKILPYILVEENNYRKPEQLRKLLKTGQHTVILYDEQPFLKPAGIRNRTDSNLLNDYLGNNFKTNIRYRYSNGSNLSMGFNADKDIGEPFFNKYQKKGFDFYSAHFFLQNSGLLKQLAVGDYHLSIGQGVGIGSGFVLNKSIEVLQVHRYASGLRPYRSLNEFGFFRGLAAQFGKEKFSILCYASLKKADGNVVLSDSTFTQEEKYYNLIQTGYHRTLKELALKNTSFQKLLGGYVQTQLKKFHAGIGYYKYQSTGIQNCVHADFNYAKANASFFGESAYLNGKGFALLTGCIASLGKNVDMVIIYRNYNAAFINPLSNAFSNASSPSNENGFYSGVTMKLNHGFRLLAFSDIFNSPQPKYRTNGPSHGFDNASAIQYQPGKSLKLEFRYRIEKKDLNLPSETPQTTGYLIAQLKRTWRIQCDFMASKQWTFRTRMENSISTNETGNLQSGYMIFQDFNFTLTDEKSGIDFRYSVFNTNGPDARIYAFENDVPYSFSMIQMSGIGTRFYVMLHYRIKRNLELWLRYSNSIYPDETELGSGLDKISGNKRENIKLLLKIRF